MIERTKKTMPPRERDPVVGQILFPIKLAARKLGISPRLLWEYIARGEIATRCLGRRRLVHRKDLETFANKDHEGIGGA